MKILGRCILAAFIIVSAGSGVLLAGQSAGAASSSTPAPTVTALGGASQLSTAGGPGNIVDIDGTNFVDVTAIDIGGVPATDVECDSSNECSAVAPASTTAGIVFVTVTAAGGTSATYNGAGDEVHYYYPTTITATPALLSLSPLHLGLFTLTATVTGNHGAPVAGLTVYFFTQMTTGEGGNTTTETNPLCQTTTNASGVATCSALSDAQMIIQDNGYVAYTPGSSTQFAIEAIAPLLSI